MDPEASQKSPFHLFAEISHSLLRHVNRSASLIAFIPEVLKLLLKHSQFDAIGMRMADSRKSWVGSWRKGRFFRFEILPRDNEGLQSAEEERYRKIDPYCAAVLKGRTNPSSIYFSPQGSFCVHDVETLSPFRTRGRDSHPGGAIRLPGDFRTFFIAPLTSGDDILGFLQYMKHSPRKCWDEQLDLLENITRQVGILIAGRKDRGALDERLKELTCLYGISRVVEESDKSFEEILTSIVELLPPAWQYPHITSARITVDGKAYTSSGFRQSPFRIVSTVSTKGRNRGEIEVNYSELPPDSAEEPFLKEERSLIDTIARQIALILERREAEEDKLLLQEQLRHTDRLTTIGQMAAGIAHELNEPLNNILGFAQLIAKEDGLPKQVGKDLDKIVDASLHSREIVQKVLGFTRQLLKKKEVNLNKLIQESLFLFRTRCTRLGIEIVLKLASAPPRMQADPVQMNQILFNLILNAMQAMPKGGVLAIGTKVGEEHISFSVKDSGAGMEPSVKERIFEPFFTTKESDRGTGLGLSVVRDIVHSHAGTILVESEIAKGSLFEIRFPRTGESS
jgi:signal transduction histidine kinase